jgi:ankyrin repeat protein
MLLGHWGAEIMYLRLDRGANANAEDKDGWTPLYLASSRGQIETVRLPLDRGASADEGTRKGGPHSMCQWLAS